MLPPALPCVALEATADERAAGRERWKGAGALPRGHSGERSSRVVPRQNPEPPSWKAYAYVCVKAGALNTFFCKLLRLVLGGNILSFNFKGLLFSIKTE